MESWNMDVNTPSTDLFTLKNKNLKKNKEQLSRFVN